MTQQFLIDALPWVAAIVSALILVFRGQCRWAWVCAGAIGCVFIWAAGAEADMERDSM